MSRARACVIFVSFVLYRKAILYRHKGMCCGGGRGDYAPLKRSSCSVLFAHSCSHARKTFLRQLLRASLGDRQSLLLLVNCLCVSLITQEQPQNTTDEY